MAVLCCALMFSTNLAANAVVAEPNPSVLLNNHAQSIPLKSLDKRKIAALTAGNSMGVFRSQLSRYAEIDFKELPTHDETNRNWTVLDEDLKLYNTLIVAIDGNDLNQRVLLQFILAQSVGKEIVLVLIGKQANFLKSLDFVKFPILVIPDQKDDTQRFAAMSIFGGVACQQVLGQDYSVYYTTGSGFKTEQTRLKYLPLADKSIDHGLLKDSIDAIMSDAIRGKAAPGGVVMVIHQGNVVFEKAYGHHTYDGVRPMQLTDIFDMASITKIAATTPVVMRLSENGIIDLDKTMGHYLWQAAESNKKDVKLRDVMLHEAGFIPYIPFYRDLPAGAISRDSSATHTVKVADNCYITTGYYEKVMWPIMLNSKLNDGGKYVYSDISMYVMKEVSEHQTGIPIQKYIQDNFYKPLGMITAGYNPRERFSKQQIVPTEYDQEFRKTLLEGYVHDQGAAMAGGIAGHAGLFATANDLAIYGQLLLNRGTYGDERFFKTETVDNFTAKQNPHSRRGLGFDRKDPNPKSTYPSAHTSEFTFGHTGYTGTAMWVDPETDLIYIFLSNRVHPTVSPQLGNLAIRMRIFDSIYQSMGKKGVK